MPLQCRYYEERYPNVSDIVVVTVKSIQPMGSYVELLEYKNIGGMILHSELSRRRIRSINKLIRVDKNETVLVIRVDSSKGYIDLSKRRVSPEEVRLCEDRFAKAKAVNQILRHVAERLNFQNEEMLESLYVKTAWHFDKLAKKRGVGAYEAFKKAVSNPQVFADCQLDDETMACLLSVINHRLRPQAVRIRADFEVSCFTYEGIDAIKVALRKGLELGSKDLPLKINLIAPPIYVMTTQTMEANEGLDFLHRVLDRIKASIGEQNGSFAIKLEPRVVSDTDDADLAKQLAELEDANREVSGDDDDEDQEDDDEDDEDDEEDDIKEEKEDDIKEQK